MERIIAEAPNLPDMPKELSDCVGKHVQLPKGAWTSEQVADIIGKYQRREINLEECAGGLQAFYIDIQRGLRSRKVK